jgi:hypothetical protein
MVRVALIALSALIFITGLLLFERASKLETYTNEQEYNDQYQALSGRGDSEKFYKLREKYLTPKFELQNYGLSLVFTGAVLMILSLDRLKTPGRKIYIVLTGVSAALLSIIGYIGDLHLEMLRGSYPHWADSLGIPLMAVPVLIILSMIWIGLNLIGLREPFKTGVRVYPLKAGTYNIWYLSILIIAVLLTVVQVFEGYFWQIIPGFLWIYYYISILLGRRPDLQRKMD